MGGGASKAKESAKKQIFQANAFLMDGDLEKAIQICQFMQITKVSGLSEKDSINTAKEINKIEDEVQRLHKILEIALTEGELSQNEGETSLRDGKLEQAKSKFEEAGARYQRALILDCGSRGEAWASALSKKLVRPKLFAKHAAALNVKGRKVSCKFPDKAGGAVVNQEVDAGILIAEFRIVQSKADDGDIFIGCVKVHEVEADAYWYDEDLNDKAWFLSNDGDLCNGENAIEGMDTTEWKLEAGDTVRMKLEFPNRNQPSAAETTGQLVFWKNGAQLPLMITGIRGPVFPALCMSDCCEEDSIEIIDMFHDPDPTGATSGDEGAAKPTNLSALKRVQASLLVCQATSLYIDFQIPSVKIALSSCRSKMREAIAACEVASARSLARSCRIRQMDLFGKLKDELMAMANVELQSADEMVEDGKLTGSFQVYDKAIRLLAKVEESALLKHAQKQRQAAVSRREVAARTADRNMKIVRSKIKSIDIAVLPGGYQDCVKMTTESADLFQQAGDLIKAKDAEQWIEISKQMEAASEACVNGNEAMERGKEASAACHYQKANNFYSESASILSTLGNVMFSAEMKKLAYFALEALDVLKGDELAVREGTGAEQMEGAMQEYADALDGKEDEDEPDAGSVDPVLTGDLSKLVAPRSNTFSVYVSSSLAEHSAERKCLAEMVSVMVRDAVNRYGYEFEFVDPQMGLRARTEADHDFAFQDKCSYLIKQCAKESMGVDYLALIGSEDNGMAFPGHIDFDMFNRVIKGIPDRGEQAKIRRVILDWFRLDTNTNPRRYVMADKFEKIPALKSADKRKRDLGWQEWIRVFSMMHRGFYEACVKDIENKQKQVIRMGIMGKIGDLDSYGMKAKVQELFDEIDQDGSGEVDKFELKEAFEKLDVVLPVEKVEEYMSDFDQDGSGCIEFEEFLLMVERMLKDAKENLKHESSALDTSHCKYFMQSLMWQEVCDGMLDRPADEASTRTVAVLWGFDPAMPGRELHTVPAADDTDAIAAIRAQHAKERGKQERAEEQPQMQRPEWMQPEPVWVLKGEVFKKHCAGIAQRIAEQMEGGEAPEGTAQGQPEKLVVGDEGEEADMASGDGSGDESEEPESIAATEDEEEQGRTSRAVIFDLLMRRKSPLLRVLPSRSIEQLSLQGTVVRLETTAGRPEALVKQREGPWDSAVAQSTKWKIEEVEAKIAKLEERKRTVRNAVDQRTIESQIKEMHVDVRALKADLDQSMFVLLGGAVSVWHTDPETGRQKKLAALTVGDGFGDLTLALGFSRDSTIQIDSTSVELLELKRGSVETIVFRSPLTEKRLKELVAWRSEESMRTHYLTYAIPDLDSHMRYQVLMAMRTFRSPLIVQLVPEDVNALARRCCLLQLDAATCLFRQDDSSETGWGQFGASAFVLLTGELVVSILVENETGEEEELEVLRLSDHGDGVGEISLVTHMPRTCTVRTLGKCIIAEIPPHVFHEEVEREDVADRLFQAVMDRETAGKVVEAHVLNSRVLYALKLRRSNMLKLLSDIEIEFLAAVSTIQERVRGEVILTQGSEGESLYVVIRGELKLLVAFADGDAEREIARLLPGDSVGEMALILGEPYASTVQVSSATCLLAQVSAVEADSLFEARGDIVSALQGMAYGGGGGGDVLRARTPLGGRAATPGGVVAQGLSASQNIVAFPWLPKKKAAHVEEQGGPKYLASLAHKVSHALLGSIDTALRRHHQERMVEHCAVIEEAAFHGQMAAELTRTFAGREEELVRLVDYIDGEYNVRMGLRNQPCVVMAEPGVGKSALLAKAGIVAKTRYPGSTIVFKFNGWSEQTLNCTKMVQSIIRQLSCALGLNYGNLPSGPPELRVMLEELLANAAKGELISLVLDAIDELETPQGFDPNFDWLPRLLPRYSSIVLSLKSTSPAVVAGLNQIFTGEVYYRVYALHPSKAAQVLERKLAMEGRSGFQNDQMESIRTASLAAAGLEGTPLNCSPVFLKMAMHFADTWFSFEPAKPLPTTVPELAASALDQMEQEHGRMLIERACGYLMISRDGLSKQELMDLLSCDDDVVEEVFGVQVPDFRRIPGSKGALLFRSLEMLIGRRAAQLVPVWNIRHSLLEDILRERYNLSQKLVIQNFHRVLAMYFSGQWEQGKEIWKDWQPTGKNEKFDRGVRNQAVYLDGQSPKLLHRGEQITNERRMRELPYHVCWMSGRSTAVDPIRRTLANRPPTTWAERAQFDRTGQLWFQDFMCSLEVIEGACFAALTFELAADFLLARKIYPYSDPIREFQKLLGDKAQVLADFPTLTFQCALNAAGSGQTSVNEVAAQCLEEHLNGEGSGRVLPPCWLVHTNKDEMMDPLAANFLGHFGAVFCVTISNRDDIVMTAGADCTVRLFDATSANELRRMDAHQEAVKKCCFSPDNTQILSVSSDCLAILWDLLEGSVLMRLDGHEGEVIDCSFLSSSTAVTASSDCTLQSWDLRTGKAMKAFVGHNSAVTVCLPLSRGTQILSASYDKTIRAWDVQTAEQLLVLSGHKAVIYGLALSSDERRLVSCSAEEVIKVWDLDAGEEIETLHLHTGAVLCCALDQTGKWVVTGSSDHTLRLYEFGSGAENGAVVVGKHDKAICSVMFTHDGQFILSAGADGVVSKWEWVVAHQVATDDTPDHSCTITHIELSSDGLFCVSLSTDGAAIIRSLDWQGNSCGTHQLTDAEEPAAACRFSPFGKSIATLHSFGTLLWDCRTGALIGRYAQEFDLMSLEFPEDIDYGVAPPLSPIVSPKAALRDELDSEVVNHQEPATEMVAAEVKQTQLATKVVNALDLFGESSLSGQEMRQGSSLQAPESEPEDGNEISRLGEKETGEANSLEERQAEHSSEEEDEPAALQHGAAGSKHASEGAGDPEEPGEESEPEQEAEEEEAEASSMSEMRVTRSLDPPPSIPAGREHMFETAMGSNFGQGSENDSDGAGVSDETGPSGSEIEAGEPTAASEQAEETRLGLGLIEEGLPSSAGTDSVQPHTQTMPDGSESESGRGVGPTLSSETNESDEQNGEPKEESGPVVTVQNAQESDVVGEGDSEQSEDEQDSDMEPNAAAPLDEATPLWQFSVLLAEMDGKYEPRAIDDDESSMGSPHPVQEEAGKDGKGSQRDSTPRPEEEPAEKEPPEAFDSDRPEYPIDMETVQRILHTLDKLDATTDPKSALFGQSSAVLNLLANNKLCRRNIAIPARGIASLNYLVLETIIPYLRHPKEETVLAAVAAVSKLTKPGHKVVMSELESLFKSELSSAVKTAAVSAVAAIAVSQDVDEEEEMRNRDIRKILTVHVVAAKGLMAADASGTSDPFAMIQLEAYDEAREELNAFRAQDVSKHREMEAGPAKKVFQSNPEMLNLAAKMALMRKARLLEMLSEEELRDVLPHCNFVSINKENLLTFQGDPNPSMFLVLSGVLRVMVKFDLGKVKNKHKGRARRASISAVLRRGKADKNFRKQGTIKGLLDFDFGQQIALLGKGDTIGELSLALQEEFPATVIANQDSVLIQFTQDTFKFLRTLRPDVCEEVQEEARKALNITKAANDGPKNLKKTNVKRKTLNPVWDETFTFHNMDVDSTLVVTIYDHDIVGSHDFLGQIRLDVLSLPLNQDFEGWFNCEPRVAEEVQTMPRNPSLISFLTTDATKVTGDVQLKLRLETDKRPRVLLESGDTLVSTVKRSTLEVQKDVSAGEGDQSPLTLFRLDHEITAWNVSPADPRIVALGDAEGRVHVVRVQDRDNYKLEAAARERHGRIRAEPFARPDLESESEELDSSS